MNKNDKSADTEEFINTLKAGDSLIDSSSDFAGYIYSQAEEKSSSNTPDKDTDIFSSTPDEVKNMKKKISEMAVNSYFKMFFDMYMANSNSDLAFRLGKKVGTVLERKEINTAANFRSTFDVSVNCEKVRVPKQNLINYFFPPYKSLSEVESESNQITHYRVWDEAHGQWEYVNEATADFDKYDTKGLTLTSNNFTYRGNSFKSVNDNITMVQRMLEHTTGVVSTYLTEWDISIYLQEGILNNGATGPMSIGLLHRILQDNPSKYSDSSAFSWGALNAGISKISASSGLVNAPLYHFNPADFPYSAYWFPYDSFDRGDGLDVFYDIANSTYNEKIHFNKYSDLSKISRFDIIGKEYSQLKFKEKLYYWDCKGAAYCGWYSWRDLRYYNTIYTTPDDGLSDIDMVHSCESQSQYAWGDVLDKNKNIIKSGITNKIVQALYNNDDSLGFNLTQWKEKINLNNSGEYSDGSSKKSKKKNSDVAIYRYDFYVKNTITGAPSFVAGALYNGDNKIIKWVDKDGNNFSGIDNDGIISAFDEYGPLLKYPRAGIFYLSRTCVHWQEVNPTYGAYCPSVNDTKENIEEMQSQIALTAKETGKSASITDLFEDSEENYNKEQTKSGVPKWNPFLYGGPHGRDSSPYVISSLFDEDSKVLRNVPRICPASTDNNNNIGVEKFFGYNLPEKGDDVSNKDIPEFPDYGNTRSPSSGLSFLKKGYINTEKRKVETWQEYNEFLPWVEKWRIKKCKVEYYWEPKYEKLGQSYDKKGKDTVVYSGGDVEMGTVVEHTGFYSPSSLPNESNFESYRTWGKGQWYETAAYEWATYFQYASSKVKYYKGNKRFFKTKYPYTGSGNSSAVSVYSKTSSNNTPYNGSTTSGNKSAGYSAGSPTNWTWKEKTGDFYELLLKYNSKGKRGKWHRWEVSYVDTPVMYANLSDYWQIDEIETSEYSTSQDKKNKVGNIVLGILTLGISTLFTTKKITASKTSSTKKFRLVVGDQRTGEQLQSNDGSFQIVTQVEKELKNSIFGDLNFGSEWKKCYFFVSDSESDAKTKGPKAIYGLYLRKSNYQYVVTTTSTNKVGCKSQTNTTDTIHDAEFIEVYNGTPDDTEYSYNSLKPEIWTAFNPAYMPAGHELFEPKNYNLANLSNVTPADKNTQPFINNIFDAHKSDTADKMNSISQILYLLGETPETWPDAQKEELGTYGYGFTTYFPGIEPSVSVNDKFKKKINLQERSKVARDNLKVWATNWKTEELKKEKKYAYLREYSQKQGERIVIYREYQDRDTKAKTSVIKNSAQETSLKNTRRYSDSYCTTEGRNFGQKCWNEYKLAYDAPLNDLISSNGYEDGGRNPYLNTFLAPVDFHCSYDVYGNSIKKAKGYDEFMPAISKALLGYYTTSTFFKENIEPGDYEDIISPMVVSNSVPFLFIYSCICTQIAWSETTKNYMLSVLGETSSSGSLFRNMMSKIISGKVLEACGLTLGGPEGLTLDEKKIDYNSIDFNPWVLEAYKNATKIQNLSDAFNEIINSLKVCKSSLEKLNLDAGYKFWSYNQIKEAYRSSRDVEILSENNNFEVIFNFIYSYLNVLYEFRKYFLFRRCNKQNGTLYSVRNLEAAGPLIADASDPSLNDEMPAEIESAGRHHQYNVSFYTTQNTNAERVAALLDKNSKLPEDEIKSIFIKIEYVDSDSDEVKNYIKYFNSVNGDVPSNIQKYVYIPYVDKWAKVPFDDLYILESAEWFDNITKISKNNSVAESERVPIDTAYLKLNEDKTIKIPFEPNEYTQSIQWLDKTRVKKLSEIIKSVEITDANRDLFDYDVPYYEYDEGSEYPTIYWGVTDGVDPEALLEWSQADDGQYTNSELDTFCAARAANDYWKVILTGTRPLKRMHKNSVQIETYSQFEADSMNLNPMVFPLSGPFSQTLWPIYSEQNAPIPSVQTALGLKI